MRRKEISARSESRVSRIEPVRRPRAERAADAGRSRSAIARAGETAAGKVGLGAMDAIFGVHLSLAHQAMMQDFKRAIGSLLLTPKQAALLWLVEATPGLAQSDAARVLRVDRATMLGITNIVVGRGLITRGPPRRGGGPGGRRIGLHLTAEGRDMLDQAKHRIAEHERRFKQVLSQAEVDATTAILRRLYDQPFDADETQSRLG